MTLQTAFAAAPVITRRPLARLSVSALALAAALAGTTLLSACAPLLLGGAMVGGALSFTDRRTSGTQLEDEGIELKSGGRLREVLSDGGHVNVTSYNRTVLLTGEVPDDAARTAVEQAVVRIENVRAIVNEDSG